MLTWEIIAHGRVQGVGYRSYVRRCARDLRIKGYARNLYDGTVLVLAQGDEDDLQLFRGLLRNGNGFSRVSRLEIEEITDSAFYNDFEIR